MKKPMLTPIYLTLMHAFRQHADYVLERDSNRGLDEISMMQEYCTLRLDAGRQTGKSESVAEFCKDWLSEGNSVIVISEKLSQSLEISKRIDIAYNNVLRIQKSPAKIIATTKRKFLSDSEFRGMSLKRPLIIIDEPMRIPEMYKYYEAYKDNVKSCTLSSGAKDKIKDLPLFFVIGIQ